VIKIVSGMLKNRKPSCTVYSDYKLVYRIVISDVNVGLRYPSGVSGRGGCQYCPDSGYHLELTVESHSNVISS